MKKLAKAILITAGLATGLHAVNDAIFKLAARRDCTPKSHTYKWRFGNIHYTVSGADNKPPLLLVHGIGVGAGSHEWDRAIASLSQSYHVYAIDLLGFGRSDKPALSVSAYLYVQQINDFVRNVIKEETFLAANNLSASFAAVAAALKPKFFKKMIFIAPHALKPPVPTAKQKWLKRLLEAPIIGTSIYLAFCSKWFKRLADCRIVPPNKLAERNISECFYRAAHRGGANARFPMAAFLTGFLYIDTKRALAQLSTPSQTIWADASSLYPHIDNPKALTRTCEKFFTR